MSTIQNPHDKFFKAMMKNLAMARDFLQTFLPLERSELLDLKTLEITEDSYLTGGLEELYSDAVFKVNLDGTRKLVISNSYGT